MWRVLLILMCVNFAARVAVGDGALDRFAKEDRDAIKVAAPAFVRGTSGLFWDRQVESQRADPKKRPDAEQLALGLKSGGCQTVPLWYSATTEERLSRQVDIDAVSKLESGTAGCIVSQDRYVCERVLGEAGAIVELWKDNSAAEKRWLDNAPNPAVRPGQSPPKTRYPKPPPPFVATGQKFLLVGATLGVGGGLNKPRIRRLDSRVVDGQQMDVIELCPPPTVTSLVAPVTAEELAAAILDGKAKLTKWRWQRKESVAKGTPDRFEWIARDVTPKPVAETTQPATK